MVHAVLYPTHKDMYVEYGTACATSASGVRNLGGGVRGVRKSGVLVSPLPRGRGGGDGGRGHAPPASRCRGSGGRGRSRGGGDGGGDLAATATCVSSHTELPKHVTLFCRIRIKASQAE